MSREQSVNIDEELDLTIADFLLQRLSGSQARCQMFKTTNSTTNKYK
jgi:hypothetical protein